MSVDGYLLGYDIEVHSVKATVIEASTGRVAASATSPDSVETGRSLPISQAGLNRSHQRGGRTFKKQQNRSAASGKVNLQAIRHRHLLPDARTGDGRQTASADRPVYYLVRQPGSTDWTESF